MKARSCQVPGQAASTAEPVVVLSPVEVARLVWVGRMAGSRVPLACGVVRGVVQAITDGGVVRFVYRPCSSEVPVIASLPLERIDEVLALVTVEAS
jgi:hypothetical protein